MKNLEDLSDIQIEMLKKKCPHCKKGKLYPVGQKDDDQETYLWCIDCLCSIDDCGGYTY